MGLVDIDIQQRLDECRVTDLGRMADQCGGDLRIEQRLGQSLVAGPCDLEILLRRVQHPQAGSGTENVPQRAGVESGQFVDAEYLRSGGNLHEAKAWRELCRAREFRVDGDEAVAGNCRTGVIELRLLIDQYTGLDKGWHKGGV